MVRGFGPTSYGDAFADVYDDWYEDVSDVAATVDAVVAAARGRTVLELGAGTGRLAVPLAASGVDVVALDASVPMLARLRDKDPDRRVAVVLGDMAAPPLRAAGDLGVAFCAYNTFFSLHDPGAQRRCLAWCRSALAPDGTLAIEAFVPAPGTDAGERLTVRSVDGATVVLGVAAHDPVSQTLTGQFVELRETGLRRRPYRVRYLTPEQLDALAADVGLTLVDRSASWSGAPFTGRSPSHVSRYRRT